MLMLLLVVESLRIVPSGLRLFIVPLVVGSILIVPSGLRSLIVPELEASVRTVPSAFRLFMVPDISFVATGLRLPLGAALSVLVIGLPVVVLVEFGMVRAAGTPVLARVSGCLVVPGVPGAPGAFDCEWLMPAASVSTEAAAMARMVNRFMVWIPVMVGRIVEPVC